MIDGFGVSLAQWADNFYYRQISKQKALKNKLNKFQRYKDISNSLLARSYRLPLGFMKMSSIDKSMRAGIWKPYLKACGY